MPESMGVRPSTHQQRFNPKRRPEAKRPPQPTQNTKRTDVSVKQDLIRIFAEEWKECHGASYLPGEQDSKTIHYNVVPLVDTNGGYNDFLSEWRQSIRDALRANIVWSEHDTDDAGRLTLAGFVNNYNDVRLLASGNDGAILFYSAYNKYRQVWGIDRMAAYRSAAKTIHKCGHRLSAIDPRLLKALKARYSNRDLGLDWCPEEDRLRFSDCEIEAELDGNPDLFKSLFRRSRGIAGPLRARLVAAYREAQSEGVVFDAQ